MELMESAAVLVPTFLVRLRCDLHSTVAPRSLDCESFACSVGFATSARMLLSRAENAASLLRPRVPGEAPTLALRLPERALKHSTRAADRSLLRGIP